MCTSPNYISWTGKYNSDGNCKFDFLGKIPYEKVIDFKFPWIQVPCGQCLECRIQQARTWADRVVLESKKYKDNYFITLTYDDEHLPNGFTLVPDDLSLFVRRIRKKFKNTKIRFFGCGEYGDLTRRPHYHIILFNCPLNDLSYEFKQMTWQKDNFGKLVPLRLVSHLRPNNNNDLFYSQVIHKAWDYKGQISVGKVTYDSAAYVSQYVTKKHKPGMKDFYDKLHLVPEFVRMSTHPGIAANCFNDIGLNALFKGNMVIPSSGEAHLSVPPRYFDKLFIKKYGDNIFNNKIRYKRINSRFNKLNKHIHDGYDLDFINSSKDYRLKKKQKLRDSI